LFLFPLAELDPIAWLLAGAVTATSAADDRHVAVGMPRSARVVAGAVAAVALVAGSLDVVADRDAKRTLVALADDRLPRGDRPRRLRPDVLRYHLLAARAAEARYTPAGFEDALDDLDRALDVSPRDPIVRFERVRLLVERARLTADPRHRRDAVTAARTLVRDDPNNRAVRDLQAILENSGT